MLGQIWKYIVEWLMLGTKEDGALDGDIVDLVDRGEEMSKKQPVELIGVISMKKIGDRDEGLDAEIIEQSFERAHDLSETRELANNQLFVTIARYMECVEHMLLEVLAAECGCWNSSNWDQPSRCLMNDAAFRAMDFDDGTDE